MAIDEAAALSVLANLGAVLTAPLHEQAAASFVIRYLRDLALPLQVDPFGNLIATYQHGNGKRPVALVAHLDHPGFEIAIAGPGRTAQATLLGGVPATCFDRRVPALVVSDSDVTRAAIIGYELDRQTGRVTLLKLECSAPVHHGDFGVFDLTGFQRDGDELAMRAADDLAGVAASLLVLQQIASSSVTGSVFGVFTRAEEVGLVGASLVAQQKLLPPETIVISLECSRELPGAQIGLGPVIRVGDRTRSFSPEGEALLLAARDRLAHIPIQRQLMSGGTCEATAFGMAGYRATGVALPLINYHNVGPDNVITAERIHVHDFLGEISLLTSAIAVAGAPLPLASEVNLQRRVEQYRERLRDTAARFHDDVSGE